MSYLIKLNYKIGLYLKNELRKKLITKKNKNKIRFTREIIIKEEKIRITDTLKDNPHIKKIMLNLKISTEYIPSSRYFNISELNSLPIIYEKPKIKKIIKIIREYNKKGELITSSIQN